MNHAPLRTLRGLALLATLASLSACGPKVSAEQHLRELQEAIHGPVEDRVENRLNSELVEDVLETDALMGMHRSDVSQAIGTGEKCQFHKLCLEQGFSDDDWYYDVGVGDEEKVGKRPALIVGFDRFGTVERTYQLRVH